MPTHVHQNIGFFWNAAKMKLHVDRTCFHASLKSQTGLSSFRLPCERTLSFTLLEVMWTLIMKLPHTEVKFYPEVKCWSSCSSSLVSLEVFSQHKSCWSCRQLLYVTLFFISPLFLCLFNLEFQNLLLSVPSVLSCVLFCSLSFPSYSFLLFFLFPVLFSPSVYSLYFLISLIVLYFKSVILSFLFSSYSVLSASPLYSITIQSVLFLLVFIFLDPPI